MILQALVSHYETLLRQGKLEAPGISPVRASFALRLNAQGELLQLMNLKTPVLKGKKEVFSPQEFNLPTPPKKGTGITPGFLSGNATYLLGLDSKGDLPWSLNRYHAARDLHLELLDGIDTPSAKAIRLFFETWQPENAAIHPALSETLEELAAGAVLIFMVNTDFAQEDREILSAWQKHYDSFDPDAVQMPCLVTGKSATIARLHPIIKGVRNAQSMGTNLVSFNAPAFLSYNRDQGYNSPVGEYAAFAYGAALNHLLADRAHSQLIGDTTVVFWSEAGDTESQDVFGGCLWGFQNQDEERTLAESDIGFMIQAVSRGEPVDWSALTLKAETPFYVLGLVPNAARLSVRFFLRDSFGAMVEHLREHYERLRIAASNRDQGSSLSLWWLLNETVNQKLQTKAPIPQLVGNVLWAILAGRNYPETLYNAVMLRIRAEGKVTYRRAAILKAYLLKNWSNLQNIKEELEMPLDSTKETAVFLLGRIFSVLEKIQIDAIENINRTLADKCLATACATPAMVFDSLLVKSKYHLTKVHNKFKKKEELQGLLDAYHVLHPDGFHEHLSHTERAEFMLGYYLQDLKNWTGNTKEEKSHE
ncbi:MAG: type I-C CRISPR-associated protein Cas8c/Csd1 [Oscillospiraceae bacterium]